MASERNRKKICAFMASMCFAAWMIPSPAIGQPEPAPETPPHDEAGDPLTRQMIDMATTLLDAAQSHEGNCQAMAKAMADILDAHKPLMRQIEETTEQADDAQAMTMRRHAQSIGTALAACYNNPDIAALLQRYAPR
ncbi:MAG: hypothetical protein FWC40_05545 [Proteobacteria bacterium]|nr:hypothetical protein [Pseudomonadota bacterium]